jgi:signal peptidase I
VVTGSVIGVRLATRPFIVQGVTVRTGLVAALAGCGILAGGCGNSNSSNGGSIPIRTITTPKTTETFSIPSSAMEPTLHCARPAIGCEADVADEIVVQEPVTDPKRGDVIVFRTPPAAAERCGAGGKFVKRLIGLPGETVREQNGTVFINGKRLNEPYVKSGRRDNETGTWPVPKGKYFFMGDNRSQSCDSRRWGAVPSNALIGTVIEIKRASG